MAYNLIRGRLLALLDEGKDDRGIVFESNLGSWRGLEIAPEPIMPEEPLPPTEYYNHIVFVKNMSETVTVNGVDYQAMHRNAIVAVIPD